MSDLNPITRREAFLAAAGGQQVETPEPITREEMYLKKIAEGGGGSSLPDTPAEDGTYALQNTVSSGTGTLSWASGGSSGGGVLVVNVTTDPETYAKSCDKTAGEIMAVADVGGIVVFKETNEGVGLIDYMKYAEQDNQLYTFKTGTNSTYEAASASDYPIDGAN